jgi:hypothetical protein
MSLLLDGTNGLSDVDGTAATPAIRGTDANTGIFFPAADTIAFSEGGVESMRIDSVGNVGIGTASPVARLDVSGAAGITSFTGTTRLGVTIKGSTGATDYSGIDFSGGAQSTPLARIAVLSAVSGSSLQFGTSNSYASGVTNTAMSIDPNGNLLVGTTTNHGGLTVSRGAGAICMGLENTGSGTQTVASFRQGSPSTQVGSITVSGGSSTAFNTSSDYRLKENVAPMTGALAKIAALKPCTYTWKSTGEAGQGFIAHELQAVVPDCVTGAKDAVETVDDLDAEGRKIGTKEVPRYQGVDSSFLVATIVAALQEQQAIITQQQATISAMETRLSALEA